MIQFKELEGFHFMEVFPYLNKQRDKGKRILGKEIGTFALMNLDTLDWTKIPLHLCRERN